MNGITSVGSKQTAHDLNHVIFPVKGTQAVMIMHSMLTINKDDGHSHISIKTIYRKDISLNTFTHFPVACELLWTLVKLHYFQAITSVLSKPPNNMLIDVQKCSLVKNKHQFTVDNRLISVVLVGLSIYTVDFAFNKTLLTCLLMTFNRRCY